MNFTLEELDEDLSGGCTSDDDFREVEAEAFRDLETFLDDEDLGDDLGEDLGEPSG